MSMNESKEMNTKPMELTDEKMELVLGGLENAPRKKRPPIHRDEQDT